MWWRIGLFGLPDPAVTSPFSCAPGRLPLPPSPAHLRERVHPLVRFAPLQSFSVPNPPLAFRSAAPSLGSPPSSRRQPVESTSARLPGPRYVPSSTFFTSSTVSSSTDLCGFVSPRCHVQGSLFEGFPCHPAARALARRCPHVVRACPLPPVARRRQGRAPAFRALSPSASPLSSVGV